MNLEGMSLKKKFWRFVWPSVVAQWIFALYTMVDGMFVARGVSEVALSAVNIASPFVNFLFSVSILFEMCIRDRHRRGSATGIRVYLFTISSKVWEMPGIALYRRIETYKV